MKKYIYFTVFVAGMTTLAAELSASRLIGTVFGTSNLVWASIIGLILIYLTLGYFVGGRLADRWPNPGTFYRLLAWGAFSLGLVPFVASPILRAAATAFEGLEVGVLLGSFAAVLVLFVIPITLLGTISPFAIRLSLDAQENSGKTAGSIYGVSTLGSFIGTFLPVLVTIPTMGTRNTFVLFSLVLLVVALVGLARFGSRRLLLQHVWMPLVLIVLAVGMKGLSLRPARTKCSRRSQPTITFRSSKRTASRCCGSTTERAFTRFTARTLWTTAARGSNSWWARTSMQTPSHPRLRA